MPVNNVDGWPAGERPRTGYFRLAAKLRLPYTDSDPGAAPIGHAAGKHDFTVRRTAGSGLLSWVVN